MAKKITEKCKYKTKYAIETWVTASQYIAELVCESEARMRGTDLPMKFWSTEKWKNTFVYQAGLAAKLLKSYHPIDIINAVAEIKTITSLKNPIFMDLLRKKARERKKLEAIRPAIQQATPEPKAPISLPRPLQKKKSILDEL